MIQTLKCYQGQAQGLLHPVTGTCDNKDSADRNLKLVLDSDVMRGLCQQCNSVTLHTKPISRTPSKNIMTFLPGCTKENNLLCLQWKEKHILLLKM